MSGSDAEPPAVLFTAEELSLLSDLAEITPLFSWQVTDLDEDGWDAVFRGLRARGVISPDSESDVGVSIAPGLRALLGVIMFAPRATTVSVSSEDDLLTKTILRLDGVAVEHEEVARGLHAFTPTSPHMVTGLALAVIAGITRAAEGEGSEPIVAPIDRYVAAVQALKADDLLAAQGAWPEGAAYLEHLSTDPDSASISDVEYLEDDVRSSALSFHINAEAQWLVSIDETDVSVRPIDLASAQEMVRELVA